MKRSIMAACAIALFASSAYAGSVGSSSSVTSSIGGSASSWGNATSVNVGSNAGTAVAVATSSPRGGTATVSTNDWSGTSSVTHIKNGGAGGSISAFGGAFGNAWSVP